jgi:hypothetical protein
VEPAARNTFAPLRHVWCSTTGRRELTSHDDRASFSGYGPLRRVKMSDPHVRTGNPQVRISGPQVRTSGPQVRMRDLQVRMGDPQVRRSGPQVRMRGSQVRISRPQVGIGDPKGREHHPLRVDEVGNEERPGKFCQASKAQLPDCHPVEGLRLRSHPLRTFD